MAKMAAMEAQWGWYADKPTLGTGKFNPGEKEAMRIYYLRFSKFPPGVERHRARYWGKKWSKHKKS